MHEEMRSFNDILNDMIVIMEQHSEVLRLIIRGDYTATFIVEELEKSNQRIELIKGCMDRFNSNGIYFGVSKTALLKYASVLSSNEHVTEYMWMATKEMIEHGFHSDKAIFTPIAPTSKPNSRTAIFAMKTGEPFPLDAHVIW
jgi:predicted phosphodiesterase